MIVLPADDAAIERAAAALRRGALVAFPTETVYGLGADATDAVALGQIFACKGRPADHPLIVHLAAAADLRSWVGGLAPAAHLLAEAFWPGPLTLVLPWLPQETGGNAGLNGTGDTGQGPAGDRAGRAISPVATGQRATIGVRVPDHPVALALLAAVGRPVAAPSANRFGRVSPTTAAHVAAEFDGLDPAGIDHAEPRRPELILDGGRCRVGVESTIVELVDQPTLLRAGGVPTEAIEAVLGHPLLAATGPSRASGMMNSHYAPRARVVVVEHHHLLEVVAAERASGHRVAVLGEKLRPGALGQDVVVLGPIRNTEEYARLLYGCLREADHGAVDTVVAVAPAEHGLGRAVADRLRKAAAPRP